MGVPLHEPYPYSLHRWGFLHFRYQRNVWRWICGDFMYTPVNPPKGHYMSRLWNWGSDLELGVVYFPTNWGAKKPQNLPNHKVVMEKPWNTYLLTVRPSHWSSDSIWYLGMKPQWALILLAKDTIMIHYHHFFWKRVWNQNFLMNFPSKSRPSFWAMTYMF